MNSIKSLLRLLPLVLTIMIFPLSGEAQTITAPTGVSNSAKLVGQIYIEIGDHIKKTQNMDNLALVTGKITEKYAAQVDINGKLNNNDRKYLTKCVGYFVQQSLRCTCKKEGLDPDDPEVVPYYNQALEGLTKKAEKKLAGVNTVGEAFDTLETFE